MALRAGDHGAHGVVAERPTQGHDTARIRDYAARKRDRWRLAARGDPGMNRYGQTVGLNMIVKDEAAVIARCIASVRPLIDSWAIVDTGSSDGPQEIVRELLADLP